METFDVVVLGTGAAGLTAALAAADRGASVGVFEKNNLVGGTTAISGGIAWIPINPHAAKKGVNDTRTEALDYLGALSHGMINQKLAEKLVDTGPKMLEWVEAATPLKFRLVEGFPDYHPEKPGGKGRGGRSLEPELFSFDEIGPWADRLVESGTGLGRHYLLADTPIGGGNGIVDPAILAERKSKRFEGLGRGLIGALLKGLLDRGIEPILNIRASELIVEEGRVVGVRFDSDEGLSEVRARNGVVIATGGFEWDAELVRSFLRGPMNYPPSCPTNTGDGLRIAMKVGAQLGNMREAWWSPVVVIPGETNYGQQRVALILRERTLPRCIFVNRTGKRFVNEAVNYNAMGAAFHQFDPNVFDYANQPCWLIFDQQYLDLYGFVQTAPGASAPDYVEKAGSLAELAATIGVPAAALEATVVRWNGNVAEDHDPDFHRGESAHDGWVGDQTHYPGPRATLGPINTPPYYAARIESSALGTKGGPKTDENAAVLNHEGTVIPGLYAAGNAMSGPTGMVYGGAGGTIGPAMIFGFIAGNHAAQNVSQTQKAVAA